MVPIRPVPKCPVTPAPVVATEIVAELWALFPAAVSCHCVSVTVLRSGLCGAHGHSN